MKKMILNLYVLAGLLFTPAIVFAQANNRTFQHWQWNNATLSAVVAQISAVSGVDIIVDNSIADERVRLSLRNRTWQEVLGILAQLHRLSYERFDSHIFVSSAASANERLIQEAQAARNLEALETLEVLTIRLKNTTSEEMETAVRAILSQRGRVMPVPHTNSLVIHELPRNIETVQNFVQEMDREMLQISISAKIIEISSNDRQEMGIQWSVFDNVGSAENFAPIMGALQRVSYGILDPIQLNITMEHLFTRGNSEIIGEPQITTIENRQARIFMGSQVPVTQLDFAGNTVVQMVNAGTELIVTPTVTGQGQIMMALNPTRRSFRETTSGIIIDEQGAQTNVVVQNGETIVIGGLAGDEREEQMGGIPLLMDIPILGVFFRRSMRRNERRDLVIFVTPNIIRRTQLEIATSAENGEEQTLQTEATVFTPSARIDEHRANNNRNRRRR